MENHDLNFISEGDLEINTSLSSFLALTSTLNNMGITFRSYSFEDSVLAKHASLTQQNQTLSVLLYINSSYWYGEKRNNIAKLVFFLKDYGLEYIYPCVSTESNANFTIFPIPNFWKDFKWDNRPVHISDFFSIPPSLQPKELFNQYFNKYGSWFYDSESRSKNSLNTDWRREAINSAYEGDASNMWNTD